MKSTQIVGKNACKWFSIRLLWPSWRKPNSFPASTTAFQITEPSALSPNSSYPTSPDMPPRYRRTFLPAIITSRKEINARSPTDSPVTFSITAVEIGPWTWKLKISPVKSSTVTSQPSGRIIKPGAIIAPPVRRIWSSASRNAMPSPIIFPLGRTDTMWRPFPTGNFL